MELIPLGSNLIRPQNGILNFPVEISEIIVRYLDCPKDNRLQRVNKIWHAFLGWFLKKHPEFANLGQAICKKIWNDNGWKIEEKIPKLPPNIMKILNSPSPFKQLQGKTKKTVTDDFDLLYVPVKYNDKNFTEKNISDHSLCVSVYSNDIQRPNSSLKGYWMLIAKQPFNSDRGSSIHSVNYEIDKKKFPQFPGKLDFPTVKEVMTAYLIRSKTIENPNVETICRDKYGWKSSGKAIHIYVIKQVGGIHLSKKQENDFYFQVMPVCRLPIQSEPETKD